MQRRVPAPLAMVALLVVAAVLVLARPGASGATYVSSSRHPASTVTAASDWTPPTVALRSLGTVVNGSVTVTADASDGESGVAQVVLQYVAPGASTWTTLCTVAAAPYSCSWSTGAGADGAYTLRAVATDKAGYTTTSSTVDTTVANKLLVTLADPGDVVRGTVPLTATVLNGGGQTWSVSIQYAVTGTTTWKNVCTTAIAPYTCSWSTTGLTSGESYDLRAVATAGSTSATSASIVDTLVDNVPPTVAMTDPGSPLRGTVTLAASALDAESGIAQVVVQAQASGGTTWTTLCTMTLDPYSCRYDTTKLADGGYAFRAIATDAAGLVATSAATAVRTVDNTVSSVAMEDPGAFLSGTVNLQASASSTAGVTSVRIDRAAAGTTAWTAVCTDSSAPFGCTWDTTTVGDGAYDFRAVLVDGAGRTTTSATLGNRRVDNNPLRGYDVQAVNGGAVAGRLDAGDTWRLTYTDQVQLGTITAGWTGAATSVTVRLRDGMLLGQGSRADVLDVLRGSATVNLGSVNLRSDFVKNNKSATFNATMVASTTTVNGRTATVVTLTLGTLATGGSLRTSTAASAMVWTPSAAVTDATGRALSVAPVTELGTADRDF